jgi:hypothetical protein
MTTTMMNLNKEWHNELKLRHELSYLYLEEKRNHGTCPGMGSPM